MFIGWYDGCHVRGGVVSRTGGFRCQSAGPLTVTVPRLPESPTCTSGSPSPRQRRPCGYAHDAEDDRCQADASCIQSTWASNSVARQSNWATIGGTQ